MSTTSNLWRKLSRSKKYREEFVAAQVKRGIPFQARAMLKSREGWTQETLAEKSGLTQGVISRALNPNYGNLTLNTIIRLAAGFDVAFVGKFVPFSELEREFESMSEQSAKTVPAFEEENRNVGEENTASTSIRSSFVFPSTKPFNLVWPSVSSAGAYLNGFEEIPWTMHLNQMSNTPAYVYGR